MTLNFPFKNKSSNFSNLKGQAETDYEFSKATELFTSQRKKLKISLEELSNKTKISRSVLIAIENGWKKHLPEKTYLITMIKRLEVELHLEIGSLNGLLIQKIIINNLSTFKFKFVNIDFLNSWFGSLLYFIVMLLSILALNSQQKHLLKINSISTEPVIMNETEKVIDKKSTTKRKE